MNRKSLVIAFVLLSAILLVSPLIGTAAAACNTDRHQDKCQKFGVTASFSFLKILQADHKYIPSADHVKKLVISWDEEFITYDITVDGITYSLGKDFTYSGHAVMTFYNPVFDDPQLGNLYPTAFSALQERIVYKYDFSAVPGGIDGTIRMIATTENGVLSIRSLCGTGDFRNVHIKATATDTFDEATLTVNIFHDGKVSGWPCVVPATDTYYQVTYDQLTTMCLAAGLPANPYPAPTVPTVTGPDQSTNWVLTIKGASEYYVFTITLGDKAYPGISCTVYDLTLNVLTGEGQLVYYKGPHYFGELGKMKNGFNAFVTVDLHGLAPDNYFTATYVFQGFGHFAHQSLMEWQDSRVSAGVATGYCVVRMDRCK
jgi:hypothetical protein